MSTQITENTAGKTAGNTTANAAAATVVPPVRLAVDTLAPHINRAMNALDAASREVSLESSLLELVRARASQLNGCAYCVDMHSRDARDGGESERRLYALAVWRETPFFTARERAALALAEAVTQLGAHGVADDVYDEAAALFDEDELPRLIAMCVAMNAWNRIGVTCRMSPATRA